jgi:hypothetical protein
VCWPGDLHSLNRLVLPRSPHHVFRMKSGFRRQLFTFALAAGVASGAQAAEKKDDEAAKREAENLQRYDRNANGKLDPDEVAAMKADRAREKAREQAREKDKAAKKG